MRRRVPSHLYGDHAAQVAHFTRVLPSGCWEFTGYVLPNGYGQVGQNRGAHRVAWEAANGPVPDGMVLDHLCHTRDLSCPGGACCHRRCVNPDHLEPVFNGENVMRGRGFGVTNAAATHCPVGHPYSPENTYYRPDRPGRLCRICRRETNRLARERNREAIAARARMLRAGLKTPDALIREWAIGNGLLIADRGAIPRRIRAEYEAARKRTEAA